MLYRDCSAELCEKSLRLCKGMPSVVVATAGVCPSPQYVPVIRFQAAIVPKRTARLKRNDLSRNDSC